MIGAMASRKEGREVIIIGHTKEVEEARFMEESVMGKVGCHRGYESGQRTGV